MRPELDYVLRPNRAAAHQLLPVIERLLRGEQTLLKNEEWTNSPAGTRFSIDYPAVNLPVLQLTLLFIIIIHRPYSVYQRLAGCGSGGAAGGWRPCRSLGRVQQRLRGHGVGHCGYS